jgi:hypothetical protein
MAPQPPLTGNQTPEELIRPMQLIFVAMLTAQVMLVGLMAFLVSQGHGNIVQNGEIVLALGAVLTASALGGSIFLTTIIARKKDERSDPVVRMTQLRALYIIRMAILEGGTMANATFYLIHPNLLFFAFTAVSLTAFVVFRPKM